MGERKSRKKNKINTWLAKRRTERERMGIRREITENICPEELKTARCHLLFYCTSYKLNMFRALLGPSSGARDYNVHYHIGRFVLGLLYVGG